MDALRTLQILISSRTPLIAIETREEERVEQALERVAQPRRIPLFVWTMTRGLRRAGSLELATEHILEEIKATKPLSVTRAEDVEALREWAWGRAVPAA
jgi:hypothetical protein